MPGALESFHIKCLESVRDGKHDSQRGETTLRLIPERGEMWGGHCRQREDLGKVPQGGRTGEVWEEEGELNVVGLVSKVHAEYVRNRAVKVA